VLLNGDDVFEAIFPAGDVLQKIAIEAGFLARQRFGMGLLVEDVDAAAAASLYVLYTARGDFTGAQQRALSALVADGRGLVAIHSSAVFGSIGGDLDPEFRPAFELLGQRYRSHGPEPRWGEISVELDGTHPVTSGIEPFELFAEHYELEAADDRSEVIGWRATASGPEAIVTAREHGRGRVVYVQPGHDLRALGHPSFAGIVRNAMTWAARLG
jgi:type 1 glutamine amidotransferase